MDSLYLQAFHNAPMGLVLCRVISDVNGVPCDLSVIDANANFNKIIGNQDRWQPGDSIKNLLPEFDIDWLASSLQAISGAIKPHNIYLASLSKWLEIGLYYLSEQDSMVLFFSDATQTKQIEAKNEALVEALSDLVFDLDDSQTIINVYGDESLLFMPVESLIGLKIYQLLDWDLKEEYREVYWRAANLGEQAEMEFPSIQGVDRWYKAIITPLVRGDIRFRVVIRDITMQKQTEHALASKTQELVSVFSITTDLLCILDTAGDFTHVNNAWQDILGYQYSELVGNNFSQFIHPDDYADTLTGLNELRRNNPTGIGIINRYRKSDGDYCYLEWHGVFRDNKSYWTARDITERIIEEQERNRVNTRLNSIVNILDTSFDSYEELLSYALEQGLNLTASEIGSIYTFDNTTSVLEPIVHSESVKKDCYLANKVLELYNLIETGIWTRTIRERKPVYINDYEAPHLGKKGLPFGHLPVVRFLTIPLIGKDGVTGLVIVGNKASNYDDNDALQLTLFMNAVWRAGERFLAEISLHQEKERLRITLNSLTEGVITTDRYGNIEMMNQSAVELTGWSLDEARGQPIETVFILSEKYKPYSVINPVKEVLDSGKIKDFDKRIMLVARNGAQKEVVASAAPVRPDVSGVVIVFHDITEERQKRDRIIYLTQHDTLTGLYNRGYAERELVRLDSSEHELPVSVIMGDVNAMRLTNDVFGHREGDKLLVKLAKLLTDLCDKDYLVARWGSDEFIIIMPQSSENEAAAFCERIKDACKQAAENNECIISLGFATKDSKEQDIFGVMKEAEKAMYQRKAQQ